MSKAALNMAAKLVALELKPAGVTMAILHPGVVKTDMFAEFMSLIPVRCKRQSV